MLKHFCITLSAALTLSGLASGDPVADNSTTREIVKLEHAWNEAHLRRDAEALKALWADDLVVVVPGMAPMTKHDVLSFAESGRMAFTAYETSDLQIRSFNHTAIVTGSLHRSRTLGGKAVEDRWRYMKVYVMLGGHWQVVAFYASDQPHP